MAWDSIEAYNDISSKGQYALALEEGKTTFEAMKLVHRYSRDNARTPMQWTTGKNAGFSSGTPWLLMHEDFANECVESEAKDEDSVLSFYRKLAAIRQQGEAAEILQQGDYEEVLEGSPAIMGFKRSLGGQEVYTLVNFTGEEQRYALPDLEKASLLVGSMENSCKGILRAFEAQIYIRETR